MTNIEIAKLFRNVAAAYTIINEKKHYFQIVAYQKAADTIEDFTAQVSDLYKESKLNTIPGVGPGIQAHLTELCETGGNKQFEDILSQVPATMFPILEIPSFGPKKAFKLVTAFDLKDPETVIEDLKKHAVAGEIAKLDGFGEKSQSDIIRAIDEFKLGKGKTTRMLLPFATEIAEGLIEYLKQCPETIDAQVLGSLRRKATTVGDIDIAVATNDSTAVLEHFVNYPYKDRVIERGPLTSSILLSGGQQVDLMTQPHDGFGSLLQHFTGSKHHNVHLRDYALRKGLSLSEKGIKHIKEEGTPMTTYKDEVSFYEAIGLDWVPPEMREDTGEIELAIKHALPHLIEQKDIKGDFHIHSSYPIEPSHDLGANTMEEMLQHAKALNYDYLAFSEHNPSVSRHTKDEITEILKKRSEKIEQLRMSNKDIRIFSLLETDILATGELAISDNDFAYLDGSIVSIHSSFTMDTQTMTRRVLQGLSHPKAKILAHPTGRLLNQRPGYTLDWDQIFDFCEKNNKALEVNAWPTRLDLPDSLIKEAISHGIKLVINTDSHATGHMNNMRYGVWMARRGWAKRSDILNAQDYTTVEEWLKK